MVEVKVGKHSWCFDWHGPECLEVVRNDIRVGFYHPKLPKTEKIIDIGLEMLCEDVRNAIYVERESIMDRRVLGLDKAEEAQTSKLIKDIEATEKKARKALKDLGYPAEEKEKKHGAVR